MIQKTKLITDITQSKPKRNRTPEFMFDYREMPKLSVIELIDINGSKFYMMKVFNKYMINIETEQTYNFVHTGLNPKLCNSTYRTNMHPIIVSEWKHKDANITLR